MHRTGLPTAWKQAVRLDGQDPEYLRVLPLLFGIDAQLKVAEAVVEAVAAAACGGAATAARS